MATKIFIIILLHFLVFSEGIFEVKDPLQRGNENLQTKDKENNVTCEEFVSNSTFDKNKLVNTDWKLFFVWNTELFATYHVRFSLPTKVLLDRYKVEFDHILGRPLNWSLAELFMETGVKFSALFMKTDIPGIYSAVPSTAFQMNYLPKIKFAFKLVEPGYFGMLQCKIRVLQAFAPYDMMPNDKDVYQAAAKLAFSSAINMTYIEMERKMEIAKKESEKNFQFKSKRSLGDDVEDYEELEISRDINALRIF